MLNILWGGMILVGILYGGISGNFEAVTLSAIDSAKEAVNLCITMLGVVSMWSGLMKVAENSGLVEGLTEKMHGILNFLFPKIPKEHPALKYIAMNMIANMLGLGWAATPAGLKAMKELKNLEIERGTKVHVASNEMCTFLVLNISSLQLVPVNIIAYRSQYGSVNPAAVIGPGLIVTAVSTIVAVIYCKIKCAGKNS